MTLNPRMLCSSPWAHPLAGAPRMTQSAPPNKQIATQQADHMLMHHTLSSSLWAQAPAGAPPPPPRGQRVQCPQPRPQPWAPQPPQRGQPAQQPPRCTAKQQITTEGVRDMVEMRALQRGLHTLVKLVMSVKPRNIHVQLLNRMGQSNVVPDRQVLC